MGIEDVSIDNGVKCSHEENKLRLRDAREVCLEAPSAFIPIV